jgi:uncharacterized protein (DUF433 family)
MQLEDYFDFLAPHDIRIKGHRIGIETVLYEYIYRERSPEEIVRTYETLSLEQVYATILYYLRKKEAVSKYMADWLDHCRKSYEASQQKHGAFHEKLRRLKAEHQARQEVPEAQVQT